MRYHLDEKLIQRAVEMMATNCGKSLNDLSEWSLERYKRDAVSVLSVASVACDSDLLSAAKDALESLKRLTNEPGAYRVTAIRQLEDAIAKAEK